LLNFKIEKFKYEELERFVKPKVLKKIKSLRKFYGKN
jgi:hypothetical protein